MLRRAAALVLASTLALVACGSDGGATASSDPAADRAAVRASIRSFESDLRDSGFAVDPDADTSDDDLTFDSADCKEFQQAFGGEHLPGETADKDSRPYKRGEFDGVGGVQESVEGSAARVGKASDLDGIFALFRDDRMARCMQEAVDAEFAKSEDEDLTVSPLKVDAQDLAGTGDDATLLHITSSVQTNGLDVPFVIDVGLARRDRGAVMVLITTIGSDTPKTKAPHLLAGMLDGLGAAA